jgi:hypothetical protein
VGTITDAGETAGDEYSVDLRAGDVVSLAVRATSGVDAGVSLVGPSSDNVVAVDLDSTPGPIAEPHDAQVYSYPVDTSGTYRVNVWGKGRTTGSYRLDLFLSRTPEPPPASVVARRVFYNRSAVATRSAGAAADDSAIAPDKLALTPGGAATLDNVTNYARGINGIIIDVAGLRGDIGLGDFVFEMSVPDAAGAWAAAPSPAPITRRAGAGAGGSDRITLVWPDGAIVDRWLRVTLRASSASGLQADDIFQFGNLIGETGDDPAAAVVSPGDFLRVRSRRSASVGVTEPCDFNRDGRVNALDEAVARGRVGHGLVLSGQSAPAARVPAGVPPPRPRSAPLRRAWYEPDVVDGSPSLFTP